MVDDVVVVGAAGPLGRRVVAALLDDPAVGRLVAVDRHPWPGRRGRGSGPAGASDRLEVVVGEPDGPEAKRLLEGADALVHLAPTTLDDPGLDGTGTGSLDVGRLRSLLEAAGDAGVRRVVLLSSATVYGADDANPVPLTEAAPVRPDPGLDHAVVRARAEEVAAEWRDAHPGSAVAVLRPVVVAAAETGEWFVRSPWSTAGLTLDGEAPSQFLHLDDLATAVAVAVRTGLDGPANVAPDGWIPAEALAALGGPARRVTVPRRLGRRVAAGLWRTGRSPLPPEALGYALHPWVVANDRLVALGWAPAHTNEEVYVEADAGGPLASLSARRRQQLALGAVGVVAAAAAAAVAVALRRRPT